MFARFTSIYEIATRIYVRLHKNLFKKECKKSTQGILIESHKLLRYCSSCMRGWFLNTDGKFLCLLFARWWDVQKNIDNRGKSWIENEMKRVDNLNFFDAHKLKVFVHPLQSNKPKIPNTPDSKRLLHIFYTFIVTNSINWMSSGRLLIYGFKIFMPQKKFF